MMKKELKKDIATGRNLRTTFEQLESEERFDENINPIDWDNAAPVTTDFPYIPKGLLKFKYFLINTFVVKPFTWYQAKIVYRIKTVGKRNLKGIKSAVVTSNHVAIFDCLVNAYALKPKRVKTVGAEFNNRKGHFGEQMRVGGMLPLSSKKEIMRKFNAALEHYARRGQYIMFYPEQSMWEGYEKPRPYKKGAFHYAIKLDIPVVPMFITYRAGKKGKASSPGEINEAIKDTSVRKYFTVNITPPLYPDKSLPLAGQAKDLADRAYQACVEVYERTYGKKLEYSEKNKAMLAGLNPAPLE